MSASPRSEITGYFGDLARLAAAADGALGASVEAAAALVGDAVLGGRQVLAFGNGGSATQSLHFAAELVVRYRDERPALAAIALAADIATLTACSNDYDFSVVFSRQVEALGRAGDVALGISTSGKSPNVLKALGAARGRGLRTILLTGEKGRAEAERWDAGIVVPSTVTSHIQELHLAALHLICQLVDDRIRASAASTS